jgi:hypothetical protein
VRTLIFSDTFKDGNKLRQIRYMISSSSPSITLPGFRVVTLQHACLPRSSQYGGALKGLTIHCVSFLANAMSLTLVQTLHATKLLPILYFRNSFKTSIALLNMKLGSGELPSSQPMYLTTSWKGLGFANLFKRDERLVTVKTDE